MITYRDTGQNDDYRRMHLDDFSGVDDVFKYDSTLEAVLFGIDITEQSPVTDVSVPRIKRTY